MPTGLVAAVHKHARGLAEWTTRNDPRKDEPCMRKATDLKPTKG